MKNNRLHNRRRVGYILLLAMVFFLFFHLLVALCILPYEYLWGQAVTSQASLMRAEIFAVIFILVFILGILIGMGVIKLPHSLGNGIIIVEMIYMILNTLGYLRNDTLTLKITMSIFCLVIVLLSGLFLSLSPKRKTSSK